MKERISSLMDGEFEPETAEPLFKALAADAGLRKTWDVYHLIGDSLRGNPEFSADFEARLRACLEAEPTVLAPRRAHRPRPSLVWSAVASVAAVVFVGWVAMQQLQSPRPDMPGVAENSVSPESVNSYLLAHHELSPGGVHVPHYVRPVAFAGSGN